MSEERMPNPRDGTVSAIERMIKTLVDKTFSAIGTPMPERSAALENLPDPDSVDMPDIRQAVASQLNDYHAMLEGQLSKDRAGPFGGASMAMDMLGLLIDKAGAEGGRDELERCVTTLGMLMRGGRSELADASAAAELYVTAAGHGSERAWPELHTRLNEEKEIQAGLEAATLLTPRGTYLYGAIKATAQMRKPAQNLIEEYAVNPVRKIAHYSEYLRLCRRYGAPAAHIAEIEETIASQYRLLPDENVQDPYAAAKVLLQVQDSWLRWSMYDRFHAACSNAQGNVQFGQAAYIDMLDALTLVPPQELPLERQEYLRGIAEAGHAAMGDNRFDFWKIDAEVARGGSPSQVIQYAYLLAARDGRRTTEDGQRQLTNNTDYVMGKYAVRYAAVGDFAAAGEYLRAIVDPRSTVEAIATCISYTETWTQRAHVQADEMTMHLHPGIGIHARLQQSLREGLDNADELQEIIRQAVIDPAAAIGPSHESHEVTWSAEHQKDIAAIDQLLRRLNPGEAVGLARELRADLLQAFEAPAAYSRYYLRRAAAMNRHLSQMLVRLGDSEAAKELYGKLYRYTQNKAPDDSIDRWVLCVDIADLLFDRRIIRYY